MHKLLISFFSLALFSQGHAQFLIERYHPVPDARRLPVEACVSSQTSPLQTVLSCSRVKVTHTRAEDSTPDSSPEVVLSLPRGIQLTLQMEQVPYYISEAYQADLNGDNRTDLMVNLPWGGNGLGGERSVVVFALSDGDGYRLSAIDTMSFSPASLVRLGGKNYVLHSAFANTIGTDKKAHSFFVYSFLSIEKGLLQLDQSREKVWIQYTIKPNSRPTTLLTPAQKTRAWNDVLRWTTEDRMSQGIFRKVQAL